MGVRFPSIGSTTIVNAAVVTVAETVLCTTQPLNISLPFQVIMLVWYAAFTTGAGTSSFTMRLRRGTTTGGTLVNVAANYQVGAGQAIGPAGSYFDIPGEIAGQQYSLTYQATGASGNAAITDVSLIAFAL